MQIALIVIGLLALLYLVLIFLTSPAGKQNPDRSLLKGALIAHRGLHNGKANAPENSLAAFRNAVEKNYPIELDLRLTKDGQAVVFHDENTGRMCGVDGKVADMTLSEIKELRLGGTEEKIPTLKECLDLTGGRVFLLIELKVSGDNAEKLCQAADEVLRDYTGAYLIQSFHPKALSWYRKNRKEICRGQLVPGKKSKEENPFSKALLRSQLCNVLTRPDFVSCECGPVPLLLRFAVWQGALLVGWTFRGKGALEENKDKYDAWIFENFLP